MSHPIVHIELSAHDQKEIASFYANVFGWQIQEFPDMNYTTFSSGEDRPGGGFNAVSEANPAGTTIVYIETDDVDASLAKIEANGGERVGEPLDIPGVGIIHWFNDPSGNHMSLLKPAEM